ncbi:MAG: hypothetical protein L3J66_12090 [Bacteroidales bacterium]|nr:hypothetical protein [Bacteroidales bacterium]
MKQILNNPSFFKSIIYLLLVGQFWVNAVSYCDWLTDTETALIELYCCDEQELSLEDNKKDKVDKFPIDSDFASFMASEKLVAVLNSEDFSSRHHPDITTPPPQS